MVAETNNWDIPTSAQRIVVETQKYTVNSPDGVWYPRTPLMDNSVSVDLSLLPCVVLPATAGLAYIVGPPSIYVVDPLSFSSTGFAGALTGKITTVNGSVAGAVIHPIGGGFASSPVYVKVSPGSAVSAASSSAAPAAGVAMLWVPYTTVIL